MKYLMLPVYGLVLSLLGVYWVAGRLGGGERWMTLLAGCYAVMFIFPFLYFPAIVGAWTVILLKGLGFTGGRQ
jgi:hypothetical protein